MRFTFLSILLLGCIAFVSCNNLDEAEESNVKPVIEEALSAKVEIDTIELLPPEPVNRYTLSSDKKDMLYGDQSVLSIADDSIFYFFKNYGWICKDHNLTVIPNGKEFCSDQNVFREMTSFTSMYVSSDETKIGFTLAIDTLPYDKVVGIFYPKRKVTYIVSGHGLGNEFIAFSPDGKYLVHRGNCWEGFCGIFIRDAESREIVESLNNPEEGVDYRHADSHFIRWTSDKTFEYRVGEEVKTGSL